ncbi:MAG TPA: TldD/PmbA family protein [Chloroflexia bacterium]|nr:TldD/PmbA family protein [Chloroflexia bacterium]
MVSEEILAAALQAALDAGADYAEARAEEAFIERIHARSGAAESLVNDRDSGWGIHVLAGDGWGFASSSRDTPDDAKETAASAVEIARASGSRRKSRSDVSILPTDQGSYSSPIEQDPFAIPFNERVDMAVEATGRVLSSGQRVQVSTATMSCARMEKLFVNTKGAHLRQSITHVGAWVSATARDSSGYSYRRSYGDMSQGGWEQIARLNLLEECERVGREADELVAAPWAPSGPKSVILDSDFVALLVHESCGHPTELDRVLGWEAAFAGTSFLMPDMLGKFQYGSPLVNMTADSLLAGGLGTFGWDEEGTPAQRTPIVRDGIFTGYLTSRESALAIGQMSNGCGRAISWGRIPIVRMVNLSLEPGKGSLDELISQVDNGLYLQTPSSWSLDDKRMNFHFSAELCREIKGGKLGELRKGAAFQGRTPQFWGSVQAVAGPDEWHLWGLPHCAKGEPLQLCPVSHGASPILVQGLQMSGHNER